MAVELGSGYVTITASARNFGSDLSRQIGPDIDRVSRDAGARAGDSFSGSFGDGLKKIAGLAATAFAGIQVGGFFKDAVQSASALGETINKVGVVLGQDALPGLEKWAAAAATAFGQSKQQALDAAATFAIFGKSGGLNGQPLVDFSTKLTELASDFSSFFDTDPAVAIQAIGAALRGESEPIRQFGVLLDDATLKARAVSEGLIGAAVDTGKLSSAQEANDKAARKVTDALKAYGAGSTQYTDALRDQQQAEGKVSDALEGKVGQLTPAIRVQAAYAEILAQTTDAQGDFARTSNSLPNLLRQLDGEMRNAKAAFGQAFLPAVIKVVKFLVNDGLPAFQRFTGAIKTTFAPAFEAAGRAFRDFAAELDGVGRPTAGFFAKLGDTVGRGLLAVRKFIDDFKAGLSGVGKPVDDVASRLGGFVGRIVDTLQLVPAAFAAAFRGDGVTSDGFIGVVEHVGVVTGNLARTLREDVPAAVRDFTAGFQLGAAGVDASGLEGKLANVGDKLGGLVKLVKDNPDVFGPIVAAIAGLAGALLLASKASSGLSLLASGLSGVTALLPLLANPVGIIAVSLTALATAAYLAYQNFVPFRAAVDSVVQVFKKEGFAAAVDEAGTQFGRLWDIVKPKLVEFRDKAVAWLDEHGPEILRALGKAAGGALGFLKDDLLVPLGNWIKDTAAPWLRDKITTEWAPAFFDWVTGTAIPMIGEKLPQLIDAIIRWLQDNEPAILDAFNRFADAAVGWIEKTAIPKLKEKLPGIINTLLDWANEHLPEWGAQLSALGLDAIGRLAVTIIEHIPDLFLTIPGQFVLLGVAMIGGMFRSIFDALPENFQNFLTKIHDFVVGLPDQIATAAAGMWHGIVDAFNTIWDAISPDKIVGFFTGLPDKITAAAAGMWDGISGAFKDAINFIIRAWNGLDFTVGKVHVPGTDKDFGGFELHTPHIDELAGGGVFTSDFTGLLRLAETPAARPEIVAPQRLIADTVRKELVAAGVGAGGGQLPPLAGTLTIHEASDGPQVVSTLENYWRWKMTGRRER